MIQIIDTPITLANLCEQAKAVFGDMVKAVVDIERGLMAVNGELHSDEEQLLMEQGSKQIHLWGVNLYLDLFDDESWVEFDSMINLRPSGGNQSRGVDNPETQKQIRSVIHKLIVK